MKTEKRCDMATVYRAVYRPDDEPPTASIARGNARGGYGAVKHRQSGSHALKKRVTNYHDELFHLISLHCSTEHLKEAKPFVKIL
jgi:hypothetical protein